MSNMITCIAITKKLIFLIWSNLLNFFDLAVYLKLFESRFYLLKIDKD